jgi:2-oxoglutarate ferredoxin oxidoreductase subunit alpha
MTDARRDKVANVRVPDQQVELGETSGKLAVVGWGSTFGPIHQAVRRARGRGLDVSHIHIRHIWPMPQNLAVLLRGFEHILVPEMNTGQLKTVLRDQFLVDAKPLNKVSGQPFQIAEIEAAIERALAGRVGGELRADHDQLPEPQSGHDDGSLHGRRSPQSA